MDDEYLPYLRLKTADYVADLLLFDKKDKQGVPLIHHCRRVREACKDLSDDQRIAAVLHDVLEDNSASDYKTRERISETIFLLFGRTVYELVHLLTRPREGLMRYDRYIESVGANPLAAPIKLADLADNLDPSRGPIPESLKKRYLEAQTYLQERLKETI